MGEEVIATQAYSSLWYAREFGPFPDGEEAIATDANCSCMYAAEVLKGRFLLGEEVIFTSEYFSQIYYENVLKDIPTLCYRMM